MRAIVSYRYSPIVLLCWLSLSRGGDDLIVNGSFAKGDTGWEYLLQAGNAKATGSVENGVYAIKISASSNLAWHVQLRQKGIKLIRGASYRFSFDAYAAASREIEASVGMEYGPFSMYCFPLSSKFALTTVNQRYSLCFTMLDSSDSNARAQFNCGLSAIDVFLDNVSLEKMTDPTMILISPGGGEEWSCGSKQTIRWVGVGMSKVSLSYSTDAGWHWNSIAGPVENNGVFSWKVPEIKSPWCRIRVADADSGKPMADSSDPFEIGAFFNLVRNGSFDDTTYSVWNPLGVYDKARARGIFKSGEYIIAVDTAGIVYWNVQFTQNGIPLLEKEDYTLSFDAYADVPRPLMANIGQSGQGFETYLNDTSSGTISLTTSKKNYTISFTMNKPSDVDARVEFNAGTASGAVHLDNITLFNKKLPPPPPVQSKPLVFGRPASGSVTFVMKGSGFARSYSMALRGPVSRAEIFDLRGRLLRTLQCGASIIEWDRGSGDAAITGPGAYILHIQGNAATASIPIVIPGR